MYLGLSPQALWESIGEVHTHLVTSIHRHIHAHFYFHTSHLIISNSIHVLRIVSTSIMGVYR